SSILATSTRNIEVVSTLNSADSASVSLNSKLPFQICGTTGDQEGSGNPKTLIDQSLTCHIIFASETCTNIRANFWPGCYLSLNVTRFARLADSRLMTFSLSNFTSTSSSSPRTLLMMTMPSPNLA